MMQQNLPQRRPPGSQSFDTRPDAVERWIADLPILNAGETSRQLYTTLLEINSLDIDNRDRFNTLEKLRAPIQLVLASLKKHYLGQDFPLNSKSRKVSDLCKAMYEQLATSYRIVLSDEMQKARFRKDNKIITAALHRAMSALGQMLVKSFQVYAPYPPHIWREIHELYRIAEQNKLEDSVIKDGDDCSANTVANLYKQILLLTLACPYRMRQGTVELIYAKLRDWAADATLSGMLNAGNPSGMFVTNLMSDDPPTYLILRTANYDAENCRILNTSGLDEHVSQEMARLKQHNGTKLGAQELHEGHLRRLLLAWGVMPKRKFTRHDKESIAYVAMGLSTAHYFVSGEQAFDASGNGAPDITYQHAAQYEVDETAQTSNDGPELWELGSDNNAAASRSTVRLVDFDEKKFEATQSPSSTEAITRDNSSNAAEYETHPWKMVNVSAGGYRLLWDSREGSQAEVGELLGIRESNEPDSFHMGLGVVRWMKCSDELGVELGVQMISPGAVAVGTRPQQNEKNQEYLRSLLLPEIAAIGQPATLITPTLPYRLGDRIVVNSHGKEILVELVKLVENTGTFAQFQFRALESQSDEDNQETAGTADFAALWKEI